MFAQDFLVTFLSISELGFFLGLTAMLLVCLFLNCSSLAASFSSDVDMIAAASRAAFLAPAVPIAKVPTGIPAAAPNSSLDPTSKHGTPFSLEIIGKSLG